MTDTIQICKLPVAVEARCTQSWLGKRDSDGEVVLEYSWSATVRFERVELGSSDFGTIYRTEAAAIRAAMRNVRETYPSSKKAVDSVRTL